MGAGVGSPTTAVVQTMTIAAFQSGSLLFRPAAWQLPYEYVHTYLHNIIRTHNFYALKK